VTGALDDYLTRDPASWAGFGASSETELASSYVMKAGEARAIRGEARCRYRVRTLDRRGSDHPFSLFFDDDDRLVLLETDYWSFEEEECAGVLAALGKPQQRLDAAFRMEMMPQAEWLYPSRGLALCVMPETNLIVRWTAFAVTTLEEYRRRIRAIALATEFETETG